MTQKEALFYIKIDKKGKTIQCQMCPHFCVIKSGERGKCRARENQDGKLYCIVYGKPCSTSLDPIEKKPFYHFHPGSQTFSIATVGCNLSCKHCQNWEISQTDIDNSIWRGISPREAIRLCKDLKSKIISFTYTEPTIFYEYMLDIAKLAKKENPQIKTTMVSNGFINPEPLKILLKYIDAFNIDLKSLEEKFYREVCGANLKSVLKTIKMIHESGKHLEITNLIIPGKNDSKKQIEELTSWILKNLGKEVPLHFSAFYPCYEFRDLPATKPGKVLDAVRIGKKSGLKYVYSGNI